VRVISKKVANGLLYDCKVKICTVLDQYTFEVVPLTDDPRLDKIYTNIREKDLETVLPKDKTKSTDQVVIVKGEHRGRTGKMLSRDKKRDEVIV